MNIEDIPSGESWACRFRTTTFLDADGQPIQANLHVGQAHPGTPSEYEGIGVIQVRDTENRRLQLQDVNSLQQFTVSWDDCWEVDRIEWQENTPE